MESPPGVARNLASKLGTLRAEGRGSTVPAVTSPIGDYLVESLLALLMIAALALLLLYGARRAGAGFGRGQGSLELLARLPLEPRRSVYVVRVLDQVLIIGASEAGLEKLGELPESAARALRMTEPASGFAAVLQAAVTRAAGNRVANGADVSGADAKSADVSEPEASKVSTSSPSGASR